MSSSSSSSTLTACSSHEIHTVAPALCITNIISSNIFKDTICTFLEAKDIVNLFQVSALAKPFQLGHDYCRLHGTVLDVYHQHRRGNNNDDDTAFLVYYLEQEAFFSKQEHKQLKSACPECMDCRLARLHGLKLCEWCHQYVDFEEEYATCTGHCDILEACVSCHHGNYQCTLCKGKTYCSDCACDYDLYYCELCEEQFCEGCLPSVSCCSSTVCKHCADASEEFFTCADCKITYCSECQESNFCQVCREYYCGDCRPVGSCAECRLVSCDTCLPHNFFDFCENNFCVDCKDGYAAKCQWGCIDCLRRGGLVDLFQSEQNEKDGNLCAHCFLSEDDMDGVKLFTCVDCGTVKYCSKACQKAHIHEHRDDCLAHEKKDETA